MTIFATRGDNMTVREPVRFTRREGHYDFCHPDETQESYTIHWGWLSKYAKKYDVVTSTSSSNFLNYDPGEISVLELLIELEELNRTKYLYSGSLRKIQNAIKFFRPYAKENEVLSYAWQIQNKKYQKAVIDTQINRLEVEMCDAVREFIGEDQECESCPYKIECLGENK